MHAASRDVELQGYVIPKGAVVLPNQETVLHDPAVWGDPDTFRPERFIDDNGQLVRKEELVPFSMGELAMQSGRQLQIH